MLLHLLLATMATYAVAQTNLSALNRDCHSIYDAVLVVDGSESIGANNFKTVKRALMEFINTTLQTNEDVHIGVVLYSTVVTETVNMTHDWLLLDNKIESMPYPARSTFTDHGIDAATEMLLTQGRKVVPRILIVVTDGLSTRPERTLAAAQKAKDNSITIYTVGIEIYVRENDAILARYQHELSTIASDEGHVIHLSDFQSFEDTAPELAEKFCAVVAEVLTGLQNLTVYEGESFNLTAEMSHIAVVGGNWSLNGEILRAGGRYSISKNGSFLYFGVQGALLSDAGDYTFRVGGQTAHGFVTVLKRWSEWSEWSQLRCRATCGTNVIGDRERTRTCEKAECVGNSTETETGDCTSVAVCEVSFTTELNNVTVRGGYDFTLSAVVGDTDQTDWQWSKGGTVLTESGRMTFVQDGSGKYSLNVIGAESADEGEYTFSIGGKSTKGYVTVTADILGGLKDIRVRQGDNFTQSVFLEGTGISGWRWLKDGGALTESDRIKISSGDSTYRLGIIGATMSDAGKYAFTVAGKTTEGTVTVYVDGGWSEWAMWAQGCGTDCSSTTGTDKRIRTCTNPVPVNNGSTCAGDSEEQRTVQCDTTNCVSFTTELNDVTVQSGSDFTLTAEVSGTATSAGEWSFGGKVLAESDRMKFGQDGSGKYTLNVTGATYSDNGEYIFTIGGKSTNGTVKVVVDGGWDAWTTWHIVTCSATCGVNVSGVSRRVRYCDKPTPRNGGKNCEGERRETNTTTCDLPECIILSGLQNLTLRVGEIMTMDAVVKPSVTGAAEWYRKGHLLHDSSRVSIGRDNANHNLTLRELTVGDTGTYTFSIEGQTAEGHLIVVADGGWSVWTSWNRACSATCGTDIPGTRERNRTCDNPAPANGGTDCAGSASENITVACSLGSCETGPVDGGWDDWTTWRTTSCSATCGVNVAGESRRVRYCDHPKPRNGGAQCVGERVQTNTTICTTLPKCLILVGPKNVTLRSGEKLTLTADVDESVHSKAEWQQKGTTLHPSTRVKIYHDKGNNTVTVDQVTDADNGVYTFSIEGHTAEGYVTVIVDGGWGVWTEWVGSCTVTCGDNISVPRKRNRTCDNPTPARGGNDCAGDATEETPLTCEVPSCIPNINGGWAEWSAATRVCSATCGQSVSGTDTKTRTCTNPAPSGTGSPCAGAASDTQTITCPDVICPVNGGWAEWSAATRVCSATCGQSVSGTDTKTRTCTNPAPSGTGSPCAGAASDTQTITCPDVICPVNGGWSEWTLWTRVCDAECGLAVSGTDTRSRTCTNPAPAGTGSSCEGGPTQVNSITCPLPECKVVFRQGLQDVRVPAGETVALSAQLTTSGHTGWTWQKNGVALTEGDKIKFSENGDTYGLTVTGAGVADSGTYTFSVGGEKTEANVTVFADGSWSNWGSWRRFCLASCGVAGGVDNRTRQCNNPAPSNGGASCPGDSVERKDAQCVLPPCPNIVDGGWSEWGEWVVVCSGSCGSVNGEANRTRTCDNPTPSTSGRPCSGGFIQRRYQVCHLSACNGTVNGGWAEWSAATRVCSATCGQSVTGTDTRTRTCTNPVPVNNGRPCAGLPLDTQTITCQLTPCSSGQVAIVSGVSDTQVEEGGPIVLSAELNQPVLNDWQWMKDGVPVAQDARNVITRDGNIYRLTRFQAAVDDTGKYTFIAGGATSEGSVTVYVNGVWTEWSAATRTCSATCGQSLSGTDTRTRTCTNPAPVNNGRPCAGEPLDTQTITCQLSACESSCRFVAPDPDNPDGFIVTVGNATHKLPCAPGTSFNPSSCQCDRVKGGWGPWSAFRRYCSGTCGSVPGVQNRTRECNAPPPSNGGAQCAGESVDRIDVTCSLTPCSGQVAIVSGVSDTQVEAGGPIVLSAELNQPVLNDWQWMKDGVPVAQDARNVITRDGNIYRLTRFQAGVDDTGNYTFIAGGATSEGSVTVYVNGVWTEWSAATRVCSATCGQSVSGTDTRTRTCTNPAPVNNGRPCAGEPLDTQTITCQLTPCDSGQVAIVSDVSDARVEAGRPIVLSAQLNQPVLNDWQWMKDGVPVAQDARNVMIRNGNVYLFTRLQAAVDDTGNYTFIAGGATSQGSVTVYVNGVWTEWSAATRVCSATCGQSVSGTDTRTRTCTNPAPVNNGRPCAGEPLDTQTITCQLTPCDSGQVAIVSGVSDTQVEAGGPIVLSAELNQPVLNDWQWMKDGVPVAQDGRNVITRDGNIYRLTRFQAAVDDTGNYTFVAGGATSEGSVTVYVNGGWTEWSAATRVCSATCGQSVSGTDTRTRTCTNPAPVNNGIPCTGEPLDPQTITCQLTPCDNGQVAIVSGVSDTQVEAGGPIVLSAELNQPVLNDWQWMKDGVPVAQDARNVIIRDGKNYRLTRLQAAVADTGNYTFIAGGATSEGSVTVYVNGVWTEWSAATRVCSATCGQSVSGNDTRTRTCTNPAPVNNGRPCAGEPLDTQTITCQLTPCNSGPCSTNSPDPDNAFGYILRTDIATYRVNCPGGNSFNPTTCLCNVQSGWGGWSFWRRYCSATCGEQISGVENRTRVCLAQSCTGDSSEQRTALCTLDPCPALGWGVWSFWRRYCSATCGEQISGVENRTRVCLAQSCTGDSSEQRTAFCTLDPCPGWGVWSFWRRYCSATCGGQVSGVENRTRVCLAQSCTGDSSEQRTALCNLDPCPALGWGVWSFWRRYCSATCGGQVSGVENRTRVCLAQSCTGDSSEQRTAFCTLDPCPALGWGVWSFWRRYCSATCGGQVSGVENRTRVCLAQSCTGDSSEQRTALCTLDPCQGGGVWGIWSTWTPQCTGSCSSTALSQLRRRTCTTTGCSGPGFEQRNYNCPTPSSCNGTVNGGWSVWGNWTREGCSVSCGEQVPGSERRDRRCDNPRPAANGLPCFGKSFETRAITCPLPACPSSRVPLCSDVFNVSGVGYRYHPTACDKYLQCYYGPGGEVRGLYRTCPFGHHWDQLTRRCNDVLEVDCPMEKCRAGNVLSYVMDGNCRGFWSCDSSGRVAAECCPEGQRYTDRGCIVDFNCQDYCPSSCFGTEVCDKLPVWGDSSKFQIDGGRSGWLPADCPSGTEFSILECACRKRRNHDCSPLAFVVFDEAFISSTSWVTASNINFQSNIAQFGQGRITIDLTTAPATPENPQVLFLRYREASQTNPSRQVLVSGTNCNGIENLVIALENRQLVFEITSRVGTTHSVTMSTQGFPAADWKDVILMYNGNTLVGIIKSDKTRFFSHTLAPKSSIMECGVTLGADLTRTKNFNGEMAMLDIYQCDPDYLT